MLAYPAFGSGRKAHEDEHTSKPRLWHEKGRGVPCGRGSEAAQESQGTVAFPFSD